MCVWALDLSVSKSGDGKKLEIHVERQVTRLGND